MKTTTNAINESKKKLETPSISERLHQSQSLLKEATGRLQKIWQTNKHSSRDEAPVEKTKPSLGLYFHIEPELRINYKGLGNAFPKAENWQDRY